MSYVPLLLPLTAVIIGVLLCDFVSDSVWFGILLFLAVCICFAKKLRQALPLVGAILLGWVSTGVTRPNTNIYHHLDENSEYGAVVNKSSETEYGYRLFTTVISQNDVKIKPFDAVIFVKDFETDFSVGDNVKFSADYSPITLKTQVPDETNVDQTYLRQGISVKAYTKTILVTGRVGGIKGFLYDIKETAINNLLFSDLDENVSAFLVATLFGDTSLLSQETRQYYSSTGLAHILALSGMHVGILVLALYILLFPVTFFRQHNLRIVITIVLLWLYATMTLFAPSVTRAVIMATFVLSAYLLYRQNVAINSLFGAALLIIIFNPYSLYNIGFQLSFCAVLSILLLNERLNPFKQGTTLHTIASFIVLPVSAILGTAPLMMYYFHNFPVYFILAAPIFTPILSYIIVAGLIFIIFGFPSGLFAIVINKSYELVLTMIKYISHLPSANISDIYLSPIVVFLLMCLVPVLAAAIKYKRMVYCYIFTAISAAAVILITFGTKTYPEREYYIVSSYSSTDILIKDSNILYIVTTAKPRLADAVKTNAEYKYSDYMGLRKMDSICVVTDTLRTKYISLKKPLLYIGNNTVLLMDNNYPVADIKCDILIISNGYRYNFSELIHKTSPEKIIFSNNFNAKLRKRYIKELKDVRYGGIIEIMNKK